MLRRLIASKLKSKAGETLVETLAAILVCVLSIAMLMIAIGAASTNNQKAREITNRLAAQRNDAAAYAYYDGSAAVSGQLEITDVDQPVSQKLELPDSKYEVDVYGGDDIASYRVEEVG